MGKFSFDVVSDFDKAEMNNAFDQAKREIVNRYDLKGTKASLEWLGSDKNGIKITGDSDFHIDTIIEIFRKKMASRGISQKVLDVSQSTHVNNMISSKTVPFKKGLSQENAKKINILIKKEYPKTVTQIQGEEIRVSSAKKDELQAVITLLKRTDFDFPLEFTNFH